MAGDDRSPGGGPAAPRSRWLNPGLGVIAALVAIASLQGIFGSEEPALVDTTTTSEADGMTTTTREEATTTTNREEATTTTAAAPSPPSSASASGPVAGPVPGEIVTTVARVVDGDTIDVAYGGERVRLIGIDTPEVYGGAECFGSEASAHASRLLPVGTEVSLELDVGERDRYGRLLAYVWRVGDGLFVNEAMVRDGYASVYTVPPNVTYQDVFLAAQREARDAGRGLWSSCTDEAAAPSGATTVPATGGGCDPSYPGVCIPPYPPDLDCGEIPDRRFTVVPPDPHGFDSDNDGIGCES